MDIQVVPAPGENLLLFTGDRVRFTLRTAQPLPQAFLRTNIGRASRLHAEVVQEYRDELARWKLPPIQGARTRAPRGLAWRDIPMRWREGEWQIDLTVSEPGFFEAKAYAVDAQGRQIWPEGPNTGISVDPGEYRSGNTIYCAFTRMFGNTRTARRTGTELEPELARLDQLGYAVIPPSGTFRDLIRQIPHIFDTLGCRVLHLLPVNPTPTTYARFGRFGSPYACLDLLAVDPALVEFDRRTTGLDQFRELTFAVHEKGGRVLLDIVINHTGWGSHLQENHPEWFLRKDGYFQSPGAWGTTWEDLVELDHKMPLSWEYLGEVFIEWCRRGVDGFRCDAGYKVPTTAWRYIIAKVRHEFPNALFLLEGLGGPWEATAELLTRGGMQWAYSELFQNYSPAEVHSYLAHSLKQNAETGTLIHYSETHDNDRLAKKGKAWSLLRNNLCALASHRGGFGFTCGVEWLAEEKINVHSSRGMAWGNPENLVVELARLNHLLSDHPCFSDGAAVRILSQAESPVLALERTAEGGTDKLLVLVNLDEHRKHSFVLESPRTFSGEVVMWDLLARREVAPRKKGERLEIVVEKAGSLCLASARVPAGLDGKQYRRLRKLHAWAIEVLSHSLEPESFGPHSWVELAEQVEADPKKFLGAVRYLSPALADRNLVSAVASAAELNRYPEVVVWSPSDRRRVTPLPPDHWLLIEDSVPFRATLSWGDRQEHRESVPMAKGHFAAFRPLDIFEQRRLGPAQVRLERHGVSEREVTGGLVYLSPQPKYEPQLMVPLHPNGSRLNAPLALLTNSTGGMARICVDLGLVKSKYDCVLGSNLHPTLPVDRHIFIKRVRVWANAERFISPLDGRNLQSFSAGPPARWEFAAICGDGRTVRIELKADMLEERNTTVLQFRLLDDSGLQKPDVRLAIRFDIEDRNFHQETTFNEGADFHFRSNCHPARDGIGFEFRPAPDRGLKVYTKAGEYHPAPEWSLGVAHEMEQTRGQTGAGDAFSPGWFDLPLRLGVPELVVATSAPDEPSWEMAARFEERRMAANDSAVRFASLKEEDSFGRQLALAAQAYVVRRDAQKTVIAGYPWFLDWGRDSLICARGLLAAGMHEEVRQLLIAFGKFERDGTLPNTIHGEDASNRDTSDAPLWYGVVCEEFAREVGPEIYDVRTEPDGRRIRDVLRSIGVGYQNGTPNGIRMDPSSGLIWSPKHFTWMDTNYPAGTPREGYPIEIQALWIRLLEQLNEIDAPTAGAPWDQLAARAREHLLSRYWIEEKGYLADTLIARRGGTALESQRDDALRSNCILPVLFDLIPKVEARRCLEAAGRYLVIPGALRSLAPLPCSQPLAIYGADGRLLNNPIEPYWGRYEGDEDTRRKPAYHNGTAWTWTYPGYCEALVKAWDYSPEVIAAARAMLGGMAPLLQEGCVGHLPEVLDGDAPHQQRGCDAQAWGATEALRVWKWLGNLRSNSNGLARI